MPRLPTPLTLPAGALTDAELRRARRRRRRSESTTAWAFVMPSVLVILGLSVLPVIWSLLLSFQADDLVTPSRWVGLQNYHALTQDPNFRQAVRNTLIYTALYVPLSMAFGLVLALALNRRIRLVGLYRTLIFVPFVISATAQGFLTDPGQALYVLVAISLWSGTGFCLVVYLAALQDVPPELMEAGRLDGAGRRHLLRHVVLPTLTPVNVFLLVWQVIESLQVFDLVYVTTKGGPLGSTTVIVYFIWEMAFQNFTAGYGAAAAYVLAVALLVIGAGTRLLRRRSPDRLEGATR